MKKRCLWMNFFRRRRMSYLFRIKTPAKKYIKKIRNKQLKKMYEEAFAAVLQGPYTSGDMKRRGVACIFVYRFSHQSTAYRLAYMLEDNMVVCLTAATHDNFYQELKRHWASLYAFLQSSPYQR